MHISNAEWQVMKIVWMKENITSNEVYQLISEKFDWTLSTVKTLLNRLVTKKCLMTQKEGRRFYYSSLLTEEESIHQITREVNEKTCAMNIKNVVSELIVGNDFTEQDLEMLEQIIKEKRTMTVEAVRCNCVS
ncbi:CopY/TcrY family copper transport repressor [Enterococcus gallinarum]|uniref:CopY/TcrY family copper transport repressor n=1 Tax=Enterococcus TaxID=1350 RepID=UPI002DB78A4D|nr:CopY/TcrY family copper transport repressor [Enterococcus gallinarum]MEB5970162.1 CopY/TcrY family copper transport repressor [Enterococcus gallinarum]